MNEHERELRSVLRRVQSRWLTLELAWALAKAALVVALTVGAAARIVQIVELRGGPLIALAGLAVAACVAMTGVLVWPLRRQPSAVQLARLIEERCPELEDQVASAVAVLERPTSSIFHDVLVEGAAARLRQLDLDRVVSRTAIRRRMAALAASLLCLIAAWFVAREAGTMAALSAYYRLFPPTLSLEVLPGDATVRAGDGLEIVAVVNGVMPGWVPGDAVVQIGRGDAARGLSMSGEGPRFSAQVSEIDRDFEYRVAIGDLTSARFRVRALTPPRVARIEVRYDYPAFSGLAPRVEEDGGDVYAPEGTKVRLRITPDEPVVDARFVTATGDTRELRASDDGAYEADLVVNEDGSYRIALADADGLSNPGDTEYFIRVMDDRPPEVRIVRPGGDRQVTRLEEVAIEARADDDYGIDRLELVYAVKGGDEKVVPLTQGAGATSVTGSETVFVESFDVRPGDFVTYYARARDIGRGKKPTTTQSDIFFLEVRPFNEEFVAAQSQAMTGAGGGQFDDLAGAQKDIIAATWKIERRALAGRSADDIRAIARAQADLKGKAAQLAAQFAAPRPPARRRNDGQPPAPAPPQDDEVGGPMQAAVKAMDKAEQSLTALQTKDALPHEMEALNQLLKAQAENERRQVAQQRGNGGGGGGERSNQDLSALFDRELLRQTETNYETPDREEERQAERADDPLEKLRELARRQDELARRQRDLARREEALEQEELKRQLERLTRDQEELRREAQQLSEQLTRQRQPQSSQSGSQSQQGSENQGQSSEGSQVRSASDEMRNAMGDMRRSDLEQAAERGARAAEQLREAERQLGGPQPDEQRRKLGDLQLETQQLAEAQRQVASQTSRAGRENDEDLLRRLAGEEARLAERVDRLQRNLGSLRRSGGGPEQSGMSAASDELAKQNVAERMRQAAEQLRKGSSAAEGGERARSSAGAPSQEPLAAEQRAMAGALDKVAERMGDVLGQDGQSRRLSEQMARLRELRDRLGSVEERLESLGRQAKPSTSDGKEPGQGSKQAGSQNARQQSGENPGSGADQQPSSANADQRQGSNRGADGAQGSQGGSGGSGELQRLQNEYARQLKETEQLLGELQRENPDVARGLSSLEQHHYSTSAPGTEAFKQDFAQWDVLRKDVNSAMDRLEASLADKLSERVAKDRVNAGSDERIPEAYRKLIAEYYRSLARRVPGKS